MIEEFIRRRFKNEEEWLSGNCYYFSVILKDRFPQLSIVYLPVTGHFMAVDIFTRTIYDYLGQHSLDSLNEPFYSLDDIRDTNPAWYERILRDCIL